MSELENVLRTVDADAARLGHTIVWSITDEREARGSCPSCGHEVAVARTDDGSARPTGGVLQEACSLQYVMKKPSLNLRATPVPPNVAAEPSD